ncbi:MAG: sulfatase-like hydrolase/transferase [Burkholderiaceae bacterium]
MTKRPNFLFVITDQQRADYLACTGHPVLNTPNIDRIAEDGSIFDRFYVANPVCMPNRACLMTGRMSSVTGVRQNGNDLPVHMTTFTEVLRAGGYDTALIGKSHLQTFTRIPAPIGENPYGTGRLANAVDIGDESRYLSEDKSTWEGMDEHPVKLPFYGFDHADIVTFHGTNTGGAHYRWLREQVDDVDTIRDPYKQLPHAYTCPQAVRTQMPEELYSTSYIKMRTKQFLEEPARQDKPFFAFVSFPDPHHPFNPPGKYWDMYKPQDMVLPDNLGSHQNPPQSLQWVRKRTVSRGLDSLSPSNFVTGAMSLTEQELREAMALTCGMIAMIDDAVGEIQQSLEQAGLADNTIVIFTSDHGDFMGDHGMVLKGGPHFQSLLRVPMLWQDPRIEQPSHIDTLGSSIDLAPSILSAAGLTPYHDIQGKDLTGLIDGTIQTVGRDAVLVEEDSYDVDAYGFSGQFRARTLVTVSHRMTIYLGADWGELYDLTTDPKETKNLWDDCASSAIKQKLIWALTQKMMDYCSRSPWPKQEA